ncbi:biotin synthase [Allopseudospirillum japonicum]|uniref:Biotin synthase n=1 Tax=Allopseudospirillum japonicum TaxID=64971 RepID=A0A1H6QB02_9GAMM|nr:biotin synthase BioB [Allopseudospirillum japonicum]SEI40971.1 biotin synthase [Allopseudospirillum japonicum]
MSSLPALRYDWTLDEIQALWQQAFLDLLLQAQQTHRHYFPPNQVQVSTLMSIKTGACPEDCKYCPQSGHYQTGLQREQLAEIRKVVQQAQAAKAAGASRFCMGAAWRSPQEKAFPAVLDMVREVKNLGLETCMTLGMLDAQQAQALADAGLDYYNHNLDTSPEYYAEIISTRTYTDRLQTLAHVRDAGMKVCCGGILGMGEGMQDRLKLLQQLASLQPHPESVPMNMLVKVEGTPLDQVEDLDELEFIRAIAVARILMPASYIRLSAGRENLSDTSQALAFMAGANSIFYGDKLLTTSNPEAQKDQQLFARLGLEIEQASTPVSEQVRAAALNQALQEAQTSAYFYDATQNEARAPKPCGLLV